MIKPMIDDIKMKYASDQMQYVAVLRSSIEYGCTAWMIKAKDAGASQEYLNGYIDGCSTTY